MAWIFNIYFSFEGTEYSAMVSVKENSLFTEYTLNISEDMLKRLPSNIIIKTSSGDLQFLQPAPVVETPLMISIVSAVIEHLKVGPAAY